MAMASGNLSINPQHADDAHYRYMMSPLEVVQDARTKQRRTALPNLPLVSAQLRVSPEALLAWLAHGVGGTGAVDSKSGTAVYFLRGPHDPAELQRLVAAFGVSFVCCPACGDASTRLSTRGCSSRKRSELRILIRCGACGADEETASQNAKVARHLPRREEEDDDGEEEAARTPRKKCGGKSSKNGKKKGPTPAKSKASTRASKSKEKSQEQACEESEDSEVEWFTDATPEAVAARRMEALGL